MIPSPKISVSMPVFNAAPYLPESIGSILNQTYRDFEFIIINDGSTDNTASVLEKYEKSDRRIRVYHQENQGTAAARNRGCHLARGKYIATMDADDISLPRRFEKQLAYFETHPEIGILGTWVDTVNQNGSRRGIWYPPTGPKMLKWTLFFGVCVAAPSVLMRREILEKTNFYGSVTPGVEDVDLWFRANSITAFANLPEVLLRYRVWEGNTSHTNFKNIRDSHILLLSHFITEFLKVEPPIEAVAGLRQTRVGPRFKDQRQILLTAKLIQQLYRNFMNENSLTTEERKEISWDAARRIASLALQAMSFCISESLFLFLQALRLDHRLLSPSVILRSLDRLLRDHTGKTSLKNAAPAN